MLHLLSGSPGERIGKDKVSVAQTSRNPGEPLQRDAQAYGPSGRCGSSAGTSAIELAHDVIAPDTDSLCGPVHVHPAQSDQLPDAQAREGRGLEQHGIDGRIIAGSHGVDQRIDLGFRQESNLGAATDVFIILSIDSPRASARLHCSGNRQIAS